MNLGQYLMQNTQLRQLLQQAPAPSPGGGGGMDSGLNVVYRQSNPNGMTDAQLREAEMRQAFDNKYPSPQQPVPSQQGVPPEFLRGGPGQPLLRSNAPSMVKDYGLGGMGQYGGVSPDRRITMPVPVQGPVVPKPAPTALIQNPDNGSSLLAALKNNSTGPRLLRANAPSMVKNFGLG